MDDQKPKIKTASEAEEYAKTKLGFKAANLSGLDDETANHIVSTIEVIQNKYPELKGAVQKIAPFNQSGAYAAMQTSATVGADGKPTSMNLLIGNHYRQGMSSVKQSYDNDLKSKWHPEGTDESSIIWHEYGHALANLRSGKSAAAKFPDAADTYWRADEYISDRKKHSTEHSWVSTAAKTLKMTQKSFKESISHYAAKNDGETFAEAFAEFSTSPNPRPECIALMKAAGIIQ